MRVAQDESSQGGCCDYDVAVERQGLGETPVENGRQGAERAASGAGGEVEKVTPQAESRAASECFRGQQSKHRCGRYQDSQARNSTRE